MAADRIKQTGEPRVGHSYFKLSEAGSVHWSYLDRDIWVMGCWGNIVPG